jgi:hypothetical protein
MDRYQEPGDQSGPSPQNLAGQGGGGRSEKTASHKRSRPPRQDDVEAGEPGRGRDDAGPEVRPIGVCQARQVAGEDVSSQGGIVNAVSLGHPAHRKHGHAQDKGEQEQSSAHAS